MHSNKELLVSVVIPVFNEEKRVARCLASIQNQTYKNLEIIVVDDGSTDKTLDVVNEIAKTDKRIVILENRSTEKRVNWRGYDINAGYKARAIGFEYAKGGWITTQDADDASILNRIELQLSLAEKYNATMVLTQWMKYSDTVADRKFNFEKFKQNKTEKDYVIEPKTNFERTIYNKGILMFEPIHKYIPFPIKWFPYTRKLFYRNTQPFLGADNCMFFRKEVILSGINFRHRNERTWGVPSGRGSGRDFAYKVTHFFNNTWCFKIPLYLWDVGSENEDYKTEDMKLYLE